MEPIGQDEIKPSKLDVAAVIHPYWGTPIAKTLLANYKGLRFGSGLQPLKAAERDAPEWRARYTQFVADLRSWAPNQEPSEADYFHQKCVLLRGLIDIAPAGQ